MSKLNTDLTNQESINIFAFIGVVLHKSCLFILVSLNALTRGAQSLDNAAAMAESMTASMLEEQQLLAAQAIAELKAKSNS